MLTAVVAAQSAGLTWWDMALVLAGAAQGGADSTRDMGGRAGRASYVPDDVVKGARAPAVRPAHGRVRPADGVPAWGPAGVGTVPAGVGEASPLFVLLMAR